MPLCTICTDIPFESMHNGTFDLFVPVNITLGSVSDLRSRLFCSLCQLVLEAVCSPLPANKSTATTTNKAEGWHDEIQVTWSAGVNAFHILGCPSRMGTSLRFLTGALASGKIIVDSKPEISRQDGDQMNVNTDLVKTWVETCKAKHGEDCQPPPIDGGDNESNCFRLIDVNSLCIRQSSLTETFVALSYVWGRMPSLRLQVDNKQALAEIDSLRDQWDKLPKTIQDSISFVRRLGWDFLWVDALCLVQDDADDMAAGIELMDQVYEQSVFTLVAADGTSSMQGLAGVSEQRDVRQIVREVLPGIPLAVSFQMEQVIRDTRYQSRAWTFQEFWLSRRKVVFVGNRMYFQCRTCDWGEDEIGLRNHQNYSTLLSLTYSLDTPTADLCWILMYYTEREMSFSSDALNALQGIFQRFTKKQGFEFHYGIPTFGLEYFLMWERHTLLPLTRRDHFPSWSWAGWTGAISNPDDDEKELDDGLEPIGWINWHYKTVYGESKPVSSVKNAGRSKICAGAQRLQHLLPPTCQILDSPRLSSPQPQSLSPLSPLSPLSSLPTGAPRYSYLQFSTVVVRFTIADKFVRSPPGLIVSYYRLLDCDGNFCGTVHLDQDLETENIPADFALVSFDPGNKIPAELEEIQADIPEQGGLIRAIYMAYTITDGQPVMERKGVAKINPRSLKSSLAPGPEWKEVILG